MRNLGIEITPFQPTVIGGWMGIVGGGLLDSPRTDTNARSALPIITQNLQTQSCRWAACGGPSTIRESSQLSLAFPLASPRSTRRWHPCPYDVGGGEHD